MAEEDRRNELKRRGRLGARLLAKGQPASGPDLLDAANAQAEAEYRQQAASLRRAGFRVV